MHDDDFSWDDKKNARNFAKHGVRFERARYAFDDKFVIGQPDDRFDYDEERHTITGMADGALLFVVYIEFGERTHIISARRADKHEQDDYFKENGSDGSRRH